MPITSLCCPVRKQGRALGASTVKHVHHVPAPRKTLRNLLGLFFFSWCLYDWVFRTQTHRAWMERPPQDNPGKWVPGKKASLYLYPSPDVHQLSPLPENWITGEWVQPPALPECVCMETGARAERGSGLGLLHHLLRAPTARGHRGRAARLLIPNTQLEELQDVYNCIGH